MSLPQKFSRDLVDELTRLLERARRGEFVGIAYVVQTVGGDHYFGMTRSYAEQPRSLLAITARSKYKLNQYISALAGEPTTDLMPL